MFLTVAICTWNRAALLGQTLEQMTKVAIPSGVDWELLVVNNNSTDATDEVIAKYAEVLPIRRLFEERPGKSNALNLAVREARGEYILWTDDDVLVDKSWIVEYCNAFRQWPSACIFGGPVYPWFDGNPPKWLRKVLSRIDSAYASRDFGTDPIPLNNEVVPFGANCALRANEQKQYLYDPNLGPRPNGNVRGEESAVIWRMLAEGAEGWWVPGACVRHFIPKERQTTRYLRRYFCGDGELLGRVMGEDGVAQLFGKPRWLWRAAVEAELRYRFRRVFCKPETWIDDLLTSSITWGKLRGYGSDPKDM